jgi:hypothetical protein
MVSFFFFYFPIGYMDPFSVGFYSFSLDWLLLKLIEPSPMWNEKHTVCVCLIYLYSLYTHTRDYHIIHKKSRKQQQQQLNNNNQRAIRFLVLFTQAQARRL